MTHLRASDIIGALGRWGDAFKNESPRTMTIEKPGAEPSATSAEPLTGPSPSPTPSAKAPAPWDGTKGLGFDNVKAPLAPAPAASEGQKGTLPSGNNAPPAASPAQASAPRSVEAQVEAFKGAVTQVVQASATVVQSGIKELKQGFGTLLEKVGIQARHAEKGSAPRAEASEGAKKADSEAHPRANNASTAAPQDRANFAERANINRFLQDPGEAPHTKELADSLKRARENEAGDDFRNNAFARRDQIRKDQKSDLGEGEAQPPTKEPSERGKSREKKTADDDDLGFDERNMHGESWLLETPNLEDSDRANRGIHEMDVLNEKTRCRGFLDDGTRCLRRALDGTPYCREHAFTIGAPPDPPIEASPLVDEPLPPVDGFDPTDPHVPSFVVEDTVDEEEDAIEGAVVTD